MRESKKLLRTWGDSQTLEMLKPSRAKGSRLEQYSILGRVLCLAADICLTQDSARLVHINLSLLVNMKPLDVNNSKFVRPCKLRMFKCPPWPMGNGNLRKVVSQFQTRLRCQMLDDPVHQWGHHTQQPYPLASNLTARTAIT